MSKDVLEQDIPAGRLFNGYIKKSLKCFFKGNWNNNFYDINQFLKS